MSEMPWERRLRVLQQQEDDARVKAERDAQSATVAAQGGATWFWVNQQIQAMRRKNPDATPNEVVARLIDALPKERHLASDVLAGRPPVHARSLEDIARSVNRCQKAGSLEEELRASTDELIRTASALTFDPKETIGASFLDFVRQQAMMASQAMADTPKSFFDDPGIRWRVHMK